MDKDEYCLWIVRPGANDSFWAYTSCKPGFNPLTKINKVDQIVPTYENRRCPICNKPIKINLEICLGENGPKYKVGDKFKLNLAPKDSDFIYYIKAVYESPLVKGRWEYDLRIDDCGSVWSKVREEILDKRYFKIS